MHGEHQIALKHFDVIVEPCHDKKKGIESKDLVLYNNLKYDYPPIYMPFILTLPSKKAVLSLLVHAIFASKHPRQPIDS
jgi:hypothetical protein